jgi:hypothetical protein
MVVCSDPLGTNASGSRVALVVVAQNFCVMTQRKTLTPTARFGASHHQLGFFLALWEA